MQLVILMLIIKNKQNAKILKILLPEHENPTLLACPTYARMRTDLQSLLPFSGAVHSLLTVVEHEYPPLLAFA